VIIPIVCQTMTWDLVVCGCQMGSKFGSVVLVKPHMSIRGMVVVGDEVAK